MSSDLQPEDGSENKKMSRRRFLLSLTVGVFLVALLGSGVLVGTNVFGKNISGTVTCASGDVMGVFVEAERAPRALGMEMQSGFAGWRQTRTSRSASFGYWLPFGGEYTLHVGCGVLQQPGTALGWATNNHTPLIRDAATNWYCENIENRTQQTVTETTCRPI